MYLGEWIAEGTAAEVMRDETVRRVYLGGALTTAARPEADFADTQRRFLQVENVGVRLRQGAGAQDVSLHVHEGEFVSVVGLNGAGKTTLFNAISGLVPYSGRDRRRAGRLRGRTAAAIARAGIVQCPETRELFGDMTVRENLDLGGHCSSDDERGERRTGSSTCSRSCASARPRSRATLSRRRAADAGDRARADDEARSC